MKEKNRMEVYQVMFKICSVATFVMFFITVGLFFLFNIPQIYRYFFTPQMSFKVERSIVIIQTQEKIE